MIRPRLATVAAIVACTLAVASIALAAASLASDMAPSFVPTADSRIDAARELAIVARRAAVIVGGQQDGSVSSRRTIDELARADVSAARLLAAQAGLVVSTNPTDDELHALAVAADDIVSAREKSEHVASLVSWQRRVMVFSSLSLVSLVCAMAFGLASYALIAKDRIRLLAAIPETTPGTSLPDRMAWLAGRERRARAVADTVWRESRTLDEKLAESDERLRDRERLLVEQGEEIRRTRHSSLQDPMTGLWRLEFFRAELRAALNRYEATGEPFAVLALDLDSFKRINDIHGHEGGNEAIRGAARLISSSSPESAIVCRSGGDEFLVLLPGAGLAAVEPSGSAIASAVADAVIAYKIEGETRYIPLRTSVGAYTTDSSSREEVLDGSDEGASLEEDLAIKAAVNRADDASKYAKTWARGRCVVWSPEVEERLAARRIPFEWDSFRREAETAFSILDGPELSAFERHYDALRALVARALGRAVDAAAEMDLETVTSKESFE